MVKLLFFVTGNKNKVNVLNKVMSPDYSVNWFKPLNEIPELDSRSVEKVVVDKLEKAYAQFNRKGMLFVTDVGLFIRQLKGIPGALIKRDTCRLFNGDFDGWCSYLDSSKPRDAYVQVIIAARNYDKRIIVKHRVDGCIAMVPQHGDYGFDWDSIFIPDPALVTSEYRNRSFAQMPEEIKFAILMEPAMEEFKKKLDVLFFKLLN